MAEENKSIKTESIISLKDAVNIIIEKKDKLDDKVYGLSTAKLDFWKWLLGTLILGIAGVWSTFILKSYELKIESRKSENEYMHRYIDDYRNMEKIDSNNLYSKAIEMFDILSLATTDDSLKIRWNDVSNYFKKKEDSIIASHRKLTDTSLALQSRDSTLQDSSSKLKRNVAHLEASLKQYLQSNKIVNANDTIKLRAKIASVSANLATTQQQLATTQQQLDSVSKEKLRLNKLANQVLVNPPSILPVPTANYNIIYDDDRYAGINYLNQIIDAIVVNVDGINDDGSVIMHLSYNGDRKPDFNISVGQTLTMPDFDADKKYKITITLTNYKQPRLLSRIGIAYYHITVEKKQQ